MEFHVCNTSIDLRHEKLRVQELEQRCSLDEFLIHCESLAAPFESQLVRTTTGLGPRPGLFGKFSELTCTEAIKLYKYQVETAARDACKQARLAEKQTKQQQRAIEEASKLKPEEDLGIAVTAFVKKGSQSTIDYSKMLDLKIASPVLADVKPKKWGHPRRRPGTMGIRRRTSRRT